jgi:hypothetical protein
MSGLAFEITGARPDPQSLTPVLHFALRIAVDDGVVVQSAQLRCQIRIEPDRRRYDDREQALVADLFGDPQRWSDTLKPFLLTHVTLPVRGFAGSTEVDLPVEFSYDLEVAAGKYLHALRDGEVPLLFLFSGTLFLKTPQGLQVQQVPWDLEARYRLPVAVWDELMELHFPGTGWLRLRRETLDALQVYKTRNALATWDDVIRFLMSEHEASR